MDINFGGIYSKGIRFFRNNMKKYYSIKEEPFTTSIVTVASLANKERNEYSHDETIYFNEDGTLNQKGREIELNKIRTIFRIALDNNHDSIVLGAFGCGAYHLLPSDVSNLFYDCLNEEEFHNKFKKIVFAIFEKRSRNKNETEENGKFKPFYDLFKIK